MHPSTPTPCVKGANRSSIVPRAWRYDHTREGEPIHLGELPMRFCGVAVHGDARWSVDSLVLG
jgi:hypothetical protein